MCLSTFHLPSTVTFPPFFTLSFSLPSFHSLLPSHFLSLRCFLILFFSSSFLSSPSLLFSYYLLTGWSSTQYYHATAPTLDTTSRPSHTRPEWCWWVANNSIYTENNYGETVKYSWRDVMSLEWNGIGCDVVGMGWDGMGCDMMWPDMVWYCKLIVCNAVHSVDC